MEIFAAIFSLFSGWVKGKQELQKVKIDVERALEENKARLLRDEASYNSAWEQAQLVDKDLLIRRICFCIFSAPFVIAYFDPQAIANYFTTALAVIPHWYIQTYVSIVGAVWGISALKNVAPSLIGGIKQALKH